MGYTVLARRYRSADFDQVIGQEMIARTLKNAIATGRVAHAYLFTGTRGVGKTSMARIFARALNAPATIPDCPRLPGVEEYPSDDVQQRMAEAIMRGDDLNVIEIDGASNRSVDEARQLIANAGLSPTGNAHFKVYIIDEVHMLTREAFNALLKTMEEPPAHVKFILCTTEAHKVPATIQSRCQRFDFRHIPTAKIAEHLTAVLADEQVQADPQVVWQVAKLGNGSMRDALSLLDRLIAASGAGGDGDEGGLTTGVLEQMLGLPDQELVTALVDALAAGDVAGALQKTADLLGRGIAQDQLIEVLIEYLRQLMLITACGADSELVELSDEARATATEQSKKFDTAGLVYMIAQCENLQRIGKGSANPRALLDAVVVRLALAEKMADVTALLAGGGGTHSTVGDASPGVKVTRSSASGGTKKKVAVGEPEVPPPVVANATNDPRQVWDRLLRSVQEKPPLAWAQQLTLRALDGQVAHVAALPGHREMIRFMNPDRRKQLGQLLQSVLGRPVSVEVDPSPIDGSMDVNNGDEVSAAHDGRTTERGNGAGGTVGTARRMPTQAERAAAMELPLVKQVLEVFDATLVGVRAVSQDEQETGEAGTAAGDGDTQSNDADGARDV